LFRGARATRPEASDSIACLPGRRPQLVASGATEAAHPPVVVIPVYDSYDDVVQCLEAVAGGLHQAGAQLLERDAHEALLAGVVLDEQDERTVPVHDHAARRGLPVE